MITNELSKEYMYNNNYTINVFDYCLPSNIEFNQNSSEGFLWAITGFSKLTCMDQI